MRAGARTNAGAPSTMNAVRPPRRSQSETANQFQLVLSASRRCLCRSSWRRPCTSKKALCRTGDDSLTASPKNTRCGRVHHCHERPRPGSRSRRSTGSHTTRQNYGPTPLAIGPGSLAQDSTHHRGSLQQALPSVQQRPRCSPDLLKHPRAAGSGHVMHPALQPPSRARAWLPRALSVTCSATARPRHPHGPRTWSTHSTPSPPWLGPTSACPDAARGAGCPQPVQGSPPCACSMGFSTTTGPTMCCIRSPVCDVQTRAAARTAMFRLTPTAARPGRAAPPRPVRSRSKQPAFWRRWLPRTPPCSATQHSHGPVSV